MLMFKVNLKANFLMCCILKDKGKKKKRKKADFWGGHMFPIFKMWLIFLWNDLNRKKKCGNLEKKESEREEEQRTRGEGQRPKAQTREEDKSSTGREERMSLKGQKETDTSTNEKKGSVRRQRM